MSMIDIEKMSVSERIQAMEELWDSLIKQDYLFGHLTGTEFQGDRITQS